MNKTIIGLVAALCLIPIAFAASSWNNVVMELNVVEKNPADWSVVEGGANGAVKFSTIGSDGKITQERVSVIAWGLEPKTEYTLIYYGNETDNDVWPAATCISKPKKTSTQGYMKGSSFKFNFMELTDNGIDEKLWLVLSSDVDCDEGVMTAWNPTEYLFEENTI